MLASIAALVLVRFFTEVVPVLPRAANFVDIPIVLALWSSRRSCAPPASRTGDWLSRWVPVLGFGFLV